MPRLPIAMVFHVLLLSHAHAAGEAARSWFAGQGFAAPTATQIIACHGYGCVRRTPISVGSAWFSQAAALLKGGSGSAQAERDALRQVMQIYTGTLASAFGGRRDEPRSPPGLSGQNGQMDCLDTTANTTSLLLILQEAGLLAYHRVAHPQSRGLFLDGRYPHFTAVIEDRRTGERWAVDPWTSGPGQKPDVLTLQRWQEAS
jgi:hypothetical protein